MSEGQSSQRISFISPASVSVAPHTRQRTGPDAALRPVHAAAPTLDAADRLLPAAGAVTRAQAAQEAARPPARPGRPGERDSAQESVRCSRARVTPT